MKNFLLCAFLLTNSISSFCSENDSRHSNELIRQQINRELESIQNFDSSISNSQTLLKTYQNQLQKDPNNEILKAKIDLLSEKISKQKNKKLVKKNRLQEQSNPKQAPEDISSSACCDECSFQQEENTKKILQETPPVKTEPANLSLYDQITAQAPYSNMTGYDFLCDVLSIKPYFGENQTYYIDTIHKKIIPAADVSKAMEDYAQMIITTNSDYFATIPPDHVAAIEKTIKDAATIPLGSILLPPMQCDNEKFVKYTSTPYWKEDGNSIFVEKSTKKISSYSIKSLNFNGKQNIKKETTVKTDKKQTKVCKRKFNESEALNSVLCKFFQKIYSKELKALTENNYKYFATLPIHHISAILNVIKKLEERERYTLGTHEYHVWNELYKISEKIVINYRQQQKKIISYDIPSVYKTKLLKKIKIDAIISNNPEIFQGEDSNKFLNLLQSPVHKIILTNYLNCIRYSNKDYSQSITLTDNEIIDYSINNELASTNEEIPLLDDESTTSDETTPTESTQARLILTPQITAIKSSQVSLPKINTASSLQQTSAQQKYRLPTPYHFYQTPSLPRGPKVASDNTITIPKDHAGAILLSIMQKYEKQKPMLLLKNEPENKEIAQTPSIPQPLIAQPQIPILKESVSYSYGALKETYHDGMVVELYPQNRVRFINGKKKERDLAKRVITPDKLIIDHYTDGRVITNLKPTNNQK